MAWPSIAADYCSTAHEPSPTAERTVSKLMHTIYRIFLRWWHQVGHVRAAEELRRTLLSPQSLRDPLRMGTKLQGYGKEDKLRLPRRRRSSPRTAAVPINYNVAAPATHVGGGRAGTAKANAAASAAVAAARSVGRGGSEGPMGPTVGTTLGDFKEEVG